MEINGGVDHVTSYKLDFFRAGISTEKLSGDLPIQVILV